MIPRPNKQSHCLVLALNFSRTYAGLSGTYSTALGFAWIEARLPGTFPAALGPGVIPRLDCLTLRLFFAGSEYLTLLFQPKNSYFFPTHPPLRDRVDDSF